MRFFGYLLFLIIPFVAKAEIYKWTDSGGKVHYSDKPNNTAGSSRVNVKNTTTPNQNVHNSTKQVKQSEDKPISELSNNNYCDELKNEIEYVQGGGSLVVVDLDENRRARGMSEATQAQRDKNINRMTADYKKYCK